MILTRCRTLLVFVTTSVLSVCAHAQTPDPQAPGPQYEASGLHEFLLGKGWRELWATPIDAPVLDLGAEAGGLTPVKRIGGRQSLLLALQGADGKSYTLRALEKDQTGQLPPAYRGSRVADLFQDQTGSQHPIANVLVGPLGTAAGIMASEPKLVLVPSDPRLGEFQSDFQGKLATLEEYPTPGFRGATEIVSTSEMWKRWSEGPGGRVDARVYLRTRLFEFFVNDWDRHAGQWRWALLPDSGRYVPVPEDRDMAFSNFGGALVRTYGPPELLPFHRTIPDVHKLSFTGWGTDRLILAGLDRRTFRETAAELRSVLNDAVIEEAVHRMPEAYRARVGARMTQHLKARRDGLRNAADEFYDILARQVEVHATDRGDEANVEVLGDGTVRLALSAPRQGGFDGEANLDESEAEADPDRPYFERTFLPEETREIRLYLHGGEDRVAIRGRGRTDMTLFVTGGPGRDRLENRADADVRFVEVQSEDEVVGDADVDHSVYRNPAPHEEMPWREPRNWGKFTRTAPYVGFVRDDLLSIGYLFQQTSYSFRHYPYAQRHRASVSYGLMRSNVRVDYDGAFRPRDNTSRYLSVDARLSGAERMHFFGLGNETPKLLRSQYVSRRSELRIRPTMVFEPNVATRLRGGLEATYRGEEKEEGSLVALTQPYGSGTFAQLGFVGDVRLDRRNRFPAIDPGNKRWTESDSDQLPFWSGYQLRGGIRVFPPIGDVEEAFVDVQGGVAGYLPLGARTSLAARVGGERLWGDLPWHEAAFLGGSGVLRSYKKERFAGDASLYGNLELRAALGKTELLAPGHWGVFGFGDLGRVFLRQIYSNRWHSSVGAGVFFVPFNTNLPFHAAGAYGGEGARFYFDGGFAF